MQADYSVELGRDDPALEVPWTSDDARLRYYDLKADPSLISRVAEVIGLPEFRDFLLRMNAPGFPLQTAKCDAWSSRDISAEEQVFAAPQKFVSYVDLFFVAPASRLNFNAHEEFVKDLCALLARAPELPASIECVLRHCHYHSEENRLEESAGNSDLGFAITIYVSGFGDSDEECRRRWLIALRLLQNALVQLSSHIDRTRARPN